MALKSSFFLFSGLLDPPLSDKDIVESYTAAVKKGIAKVMAKMGISTLHSYKASVGKNEEIIKKGAPSSLYSCSCVHVGSCTTRKPVVLLCIVYKRNK